MIEVFVAGSLGLLDLFTAGSTWELFRLCTFAFYGLLGAVCLFAWYKSRNKLSLETDPNWQCDCKNGQICNFYQYKTDTDDFRFKVQATCEECFSNPSKWRGGNEPDEGSSKEKPFGGDPSDWNLTTLEVYCERTHECIVAEMRFFRKAGSAEVLMGLALYLFAFSQSTPGLSPLLAVAITLDALKILLEAFLSRTETEKLLLDTEYKVPSTAVKMSFKVILVFGLVIFTASVFFAYKDFIAVPTCRINIQFTGEDGGRYPFHQAVSWKSGRGEECPPQVRWDGEVPTATFCEEISFQAIYSGDVLRVSHNEGSQCDFSVRTLPSTCTHEVQVLVEGSSSRTSLGYISYPSSRNSPCLDSDTPLTLCMGEGTVIGSPFNISSSGNCEWSQA